MGEVRMGKKKEKEEDEESLVDAKDDLVSAHTWKPIKRSFLSRAPLENSGVYLLSELPMPVLHMEYDWAVKKKNVRLFIWVLISLVFVVAGLEISFDPETSRYTQSDQTQA